MKNSQRWNVIFLLWDSQRLQRNKQPYPLLVKILIDTNFLGDILAVLVEM